MDTTVKLDLMQTGTRYEHYLELRDAFATGIVILENQTQYDSAENKTTKDNIRKLKDAVELIESRVNFLSDFKSESSNYSTLARTIRGIQPNRPTQLPEVSESTRRECEEELKQARDTGYAEDGGQESTQADKGTSPQEPK